MMPSRYFSPLVFPRISLVRMLSGLVLSVLVAFWMARVCHANGPDESEADAFLSALERQRSKVETYKADFIQKKNIAIFDQEKTSTGAVFYKAPRRMIWKYQTPDKTQMRVMGEEISFYFPELEQIEIYRSGAGGQGSPFFFAFEATAEEIQKNFDVSVADSRSDGLTRMTLHPVAEPLASQVRKITLWLGRPDYLPRRILIEEISDDTTDIVLSNVQVSESIADEELEFDAPEGTEIIETAPETF